MNELSKRLQRVASFVTPGSRVVDVGCDHAWVPIWLVEQKLVPSAIAMDVRTGPLSRAELHIKQAGLQEKISVRLSDGLQALVAGEAECAILAGMGGPLMIRLLQESPDTVHSLQELVLSPQSELEEVRRFLHAQGLCIDRETILFEDGKDYFIWHVQPSLVDEEIWAPEEYRYGKRYRKEDWQTLASYLCREEKNCQLLLKQLTARAQENQWAPSQQLLFRCEELQKGLLLIKSAQNRFQCTFETERRL